VTLRIAQPASLETLAIALLAPRFLAAACLGRDLEDLRCPGRVFSFLSNLWASSSAHGSRNLDYLVPLSEQKYGGLSFLVALDVLAANTTALRPAELFAILQALTVQLEALRALALATLLFGVSLDDRVWLRLEH